MGRSTQQPARGLGLGGPGEPGVEIVTPNPGSSGGARWNLLAAWGHVLATGGSEEDAKEYLTRFFENAVALPGSARDALTSFTSGNGDVLISYENEAILARQNGEELDYLVPDETLLAAKALGASPFRAWLTVTCDNRYEPMRIQATLRHCGEPVCRRP